MASECLHGINIMDLILLPSHYYYSMNFTNKLSPVPCWVTVLWIRCFCCWGNLITWLPSCCCCRRAVRLPTDCTTDLCVVPRAAAGFLNTLFVAISWGVACDTIKPVTAVEIDDIHHLHTMNIPKKNVYIWHLWNIAYEMTSQVIWSPVEIIMRKGTWLFSYHHKHWLSSRYLLHDVHEQLWITWVLQGLHVPVIEGDFNRVCSGDSSAEWGMLMLKFAFPLF